MSDADRHNGFEQFMDSLSRRWPIIVAGATLIATTAINFHSVSRLETTVENGFRRQAQDIQGVRSEITDVAGEVKYLKGVIDTRKTTGN